MVLVCLLVIGVVCYDEVVLMIGCYLFFGM